METKKYIFPGPQFKTELIQSLLDEIPDAIYFKDDKGHLIMVNKAHAEGLGLKPENVIGRTDFDFFSEKEAKKMTEDDIRVMRTGKPIIDKVERTTRPDGSIHYVSTTKLPRRDHNGNIVGIMGITRDITERRQIEEEKLKITKQAVAALSKAFEMKDKYTAIHALGVATIAEAIAKKLGWREDEVVSIYMAGELHDIGKIAVPMDILYKPTGLNKLEYAIIQEHPQKCFDILNKIKFPPFLAEAVYQHHERLDGSGYPRGLKGDEIIMEARILAVADVLEAMTFRRPYRAALGLDKALAELKKGTGEIYDSHIVKVTLQLIDKKGKQLFWRA